MGDSFKDEFEDFGDFEESSKEIKKPINTLLKNNGVSETNTGFSGRVRTPRNGEVLGKIEQRVGANRVVVVCFDGKTRNCRIPGGLKRKIWARPGNIVLVRPWEFQGDEKGDLIFTYKPGDSVWLQKKGFLKDIGSDF